MRNAVIERKTGETQVFVRLEIDGTGRAAIATGIGFLDHMLNLMGYHGLFDLEIRTSGDLQVDAHHTVEDTALCLGQAFERALGDRAGVVRTAHSYVPMDESLGFAAVDLSGRPYAVVDITWSAPMLGQLETDLVRHFLETFAVHARMNLHARSLYGRNDHHQAEAVFKAVGRALDAASRIEPRRSEVPSTKGMLA